MKEKVIDIYPPLEETDRKETVKESKDSKPSVGRKWIFFAILAVFLLAGYFLYASYRTEVTIYPVVEDFTVDKRVLIRTSGALGENDIRGMVFSERVSDVREFPIEGRMLLEEKARGEIKVCQDYRDTPVTFVEGTRFVSDGGKLFLATEAFTLPEKGVEEGCNKVKVIAAEAGEEHNISPDSKFALPGLEGTAVYGKVQGVSFTLKEEGVRKEVPYLDDDTMKRAETQIKEELFQKGKEILREKYQEEYFLKSDAQYAVEVVERTFSEEETGEETFHFKLDVSVKAIAVSNENLTAFITNLLPENHVWRKETEEMKIDLLRINFEEGEADALIDFFAEIYREVDKEKWRRELAGLDFEKAEKMLREEVGAKRVEIRNYPFGIRSVLSSRERVNVEIAF